MGLVRYQSASAQAFKQYGLNPLDSGQEVLPRDFATANSTMSSQLLRLTYFTARKSETLGNVSVSTTATAAGATPSLIRFGLYAVAANGDLTLIASTPNDTALLSVANTQYTKAFSVAAVVVSGQRYAFGVLVVTAAAAPTLLGSALAGSAAIYTLAPRLAGTVSAMADLPVSVASGTISSNGTRTFGALLP